MSYREEPGYLDSLLAVRGLCALGVAVVHMLDSSDLSFRWYLENGWEFGATARDVLNTVLPTTGKNFVLIFFVHSGYLMGKVFFMRRYATDREGIVRYYKSRFLRIAPLLYVNLALCWLFLPSANPTLVEAIGDFLFVNNFTGRDINDVTWSMSWEMQFYLLAPLIFICFCRPSVWALSCLALLAVAFESLAWIGIKEFPPTQFLFYFLLGFAVNHALRYFGACRFPGATAIAFLVFFVGNTLYYAMFNSGAEQIANPLIGIAAVAVIYLLELPRHDEDAPRPEARHAAPILMALRFWTWMGMLSYGIYLWHLPILELVNPANVDLAEFVIGALDVGGTGWQRTATFHATQVLIVVGLTLAVSLFTFLTVEIRFRPNLYRAAIVPIRTRLE